MRYRAFAANFPIKGAAPLTRDGSEFDLRADSTESEPPIDLPLHDREPAVPEEPSPLRDTVHAAETASPSSGGSRGIALGMLVLGLLGGFGAGFIVGQRLAPPAPPRAVEVPRPAPVAIPAPPPAAALQAPVEPVQNVTEAPAIVEAPVAVREPEVQAPPPAPAVAKAPVARPTTPAIQPATLRFDSRPPGATIYLDEIRVGVTPMTMNDVMPGTHQVRMEMLGHETWRTSVTVEAGAQLFVGASLE